MKIVYAKSVHEQMREAVQSVESSWGAERQIEKFVVTKAEMRELCASLSFPVGMHVGIVFGVTVEVEK